MNQTRTDRLELAAQYVNSTASHIFLTGKAGTGKTTFLRDLAKATHNSFAIVAPTGIAALNAKGVTIHSQFLLPFGSYLPEPVSFSGNPQARFYSRNELASRHSLNKARKDVLRSIDLLIIDEVSMLRADILDAIDYRLRSAKANYHQAFGGVQLLMIGDLYQLPPIVKEEEWQYLKEFYASPHFFESRALKQAGFTYIELDRIFRQEDQHFIQLLNALRDDRCTAADLEALHAHYKPDYQAQEGEITLTTHNYQADQLNRAALDKLPGPSHFFEAVIDGDFPEQLYPLAESLELRIGAQVMFVRNDSAGQRYYNGKLAKVVDLSEDGICVEMEDDEAFWLERHDWENTKYDIDEHSREVKEEVIGTFTQFPLRLAWAITVHKSQGLTFDRAVIDLGQAFAPGQVYVALSRLRSLDGLSLRTRIPREVISNDAEVVRFSKNQLTQKAEAGLKAEQERYIQSLYCRAFDFSAILKQIEYSRQKTSSKYEFEEEDLREALPKLSQAFGSEAENTTKFLLQLDRLLADGEVDQLLERLQSGRSYYLNFLEAQLRELLTHAARVEQLSRTKAYLNLMDELDQLISVQYSQIQKVTSIRRALLQGETVSPSSDLAAQRLALRERILSEVREKVGNRKPKGKNKSGRKRKAEVGETYQITYALLKEGLDAEAIAEKRGLTTGTIESHLARGISEGKLSIEELVEKGDIESIQAALRDERYASLAEVHQALKGNYSYGQLRMVQTHLKRKSE